MAAARIPKHRLGIGKSMFFYVRGQEFSCFVGIGMADFVVFVSAHVPLDAGAGAGVGVGVGAG